MSFNSTENIVRILIADDDDVMREKLTRILSGTNFHLTEASSGSQVNQLIEKEKFDCILLDNHLGDMDGLDLIPTLNHLDSAPCAIVMITGVGDEKLIVEAMRRGAYDYINKSNLQADYLFKIITSGLKWVEVETKLRETQRKLLHLSMYDSLTLLPNRQLFMDRLEHVIELNQRGNLSFAVLMMDLNLFKSVNDTFGHAVGDELLVQVGERLKSISRESDTFARLGGDEFAAILYNITLLEDACNVAEKITEVINKPFHLQSVTVNIGISIGISIANDKHLDSKVLLSKADMAMYHAKSNGLGYSTETD